MRYVVTERLQSKKNQVFKVSKGNQAYVIKYKSGNEKEVNILYRLEEQGLHVPLVCFSTDNYFLMKYIAGETLCDYLERQEKENVAVCDLRPVIVEWSTWLEGFYRAMDQEDVIVGDVNLRNFIFSEGGIFGLDFEDCTTGKPEQDIGKICAYIITYTPCFTQWKLDFADELIHVFVQKLNVNTRDLSQEITTELQHIESRRKTVVPSHIYEWANQEKMKRS